MKVLKIRKIYFAFAVILMLLAVLVAVSLRGAFGAIAKSGEIDEAILNSSAPRLDRDKIDKALEAIEGREYTPLDL